MNITLTLPDDLAARLRPVTEHLPQVLEMGLVVWKGGPGFTGLADVLEMLARLPTPEEVLALRPSAALDLLWGAAWLERKPTLGALPLARYYRGAEVVTMARVGSAGRRAPRASAGRRAGDPAPRGRPRAPTARVATAP